MSDTNTKGFEASSGSLKDKASAVIEDARSSVTDAAGQLTEAAKQKGRDQLSAAKESLADEGKRLADSLNKASDAQREDSVQSRVLNMVAGGLRDASDGLQGRSLESLYHDVEGFARRNPGVFIAGAALAGFAAVRFARASSGRQYDGRYDHRGHDIADLHKSKEATGGEAFKGAAP